MNRVFQRQACAHGACRFPNGETARSGGGGGLSVSIHCARRVKDMAPGRIPWLALILFLTPSLATGQSLQNPWSRQVSLPDLEGEQLVAIPLDDTVYEHTRTDLHDVRILTAAGDAVPSLIRRRSTTEDQTVARRWTAKNVELRPDADQIELFFSLEKEDPPVTSLTVDTPLVNFEQHIEVWQTADAAGTIEPKLLAGSLLFDYSQYMNVRRLTVALPENDGRSFRLVLKTPTAEQQSSLKLLTRELQGGNETKTTEQFLVERRPFRIDRIQLENARVTTTVTGYRNQPWDITVSPAADDPKEHQTLMEMTTHRQPIGQLQVETKSTNFSRRVNLQQKVTLRDGTQDWNNIATSTIQRFAFEGVEDEKLTIEFPPVRAEHLRLVIHNLESPPLAITGLTASGAQEEVLFLATPDQSYQLQYGDLTADAASYDLAAINRLLERKIEPATASLAAATATGRAPEEPSDSFINNPWIWGPLLAVLIVLLGMALYSAGRKMDALPPDQAQG
ncbi:MAG: DUF3999 family protein [Planctomycetaceae bacterium]|nr:DUF3999 family protein [Planctomycetaceae bacterium]